MLCEKIGQNIRYHRLSKRWTQEKLADILCVSHQVISKWENGLTAPDIDTLYSIAQTFDISLDEICGLRPNDGEITFQKLKNNFPLNSGKDYKEMVADWYGIEKQIALYPLHEELLFFALQYLRQMHDRIENDTQKDHVNSITLPVAQRILDFSTDDNKRSLANLSLAIYYSEQVDRLRCNEEDVKNAQKARQYADLVLYKDMPSTLYHSLGCINLKDECLARENTLIELVSATQTAAENLLRIYKVMTHQKTPSDSNNIYYVNQFIKRFEDLATEANLLRILE